MVIDCGTALHGWRFEAGGLVDRRILLPHSEEERHLHDHAFLRSRHHVPKAEIDLIVQE